MAVKIRMKKMGRKHRPFFRICAVDARNPRDGRVLEELGTYDPMVGDADARALLKPDRIDYWLGVGARPSDKVRTLIKKTACPERIWNNSGRCASVWRCRAVVPDAGTPVYVPPAPGEAAARRGRLGKRHRRGHARAGNQCFRIVFLGWRTPAPRRSEPIA